MSNEREIKESFKKASYGIPRFGKTMSFSSEGLKIQSDDHILSIASAGCNAFAMLLEEPASVTAVDLNPSQTAICHLKRLVIFICLIAEFVSLMGVRKERRLSRRLRQD